MNVIKLLRDYFLLLKSDFFDSKYYLKENIDVAKAKANPILHYLKFGWKEGRDPSPLFNMNDYISFRPDILEADICPLVHYELFGKREFLSFCFNKIKHLENEISNLNTKINNLDNKLDNKTNNLDDKFVTRAAYLYGKIINRAKDSKNIRNNLLFLYKNGINKEKVSFEIEKFLNSSESGITNEKREFELIVSLTSYPDRIYDIHYCVYSLLKQSLKPNKIILWLGEEQFPNRDKDLPIKLLEFLKYGLEIKYTKDIGSYKKLIPTLKEYPNSIIVTADDDIFYRQNWLEKLYNHWKCNKNVVIVHRADKIKIKDDKILPFNQWERRTISDNSSFCFLMLSGSGALFPPNCLYKDVFNEELFKNLTPNADDIWFWAMAVLNNTKIKIVDEPQKTFIYVNPARERRFNGDSTLYSINKYENDAQLEKVLNHYPQIMEKLLQEKLI